MLDRPVDAKWQKAFRSMGVRHPSKQPPAAFQFRGATATVTAKADEVQSVLNFFKGWLGPATAKRNKLLRREAQVEAQRREEEAARERSRLELRARVLRDVKI